MPGVIGVDGIVVRAPNLPRWSGAGIGPLFDGLPVTMADEADLAALAEPWFTDGPSDVLVRLRRRRGGRRDRSGRAGVPRGRGTGGLGHVVVDPDGPGCRCGGHGCLEQVAGQEALLRAAGTPDPDDPRYLLDQAR